MRMSREDVINRCARVTFYPSRLSPTKSQIDIRFIWLIEKDALYFSNFDPLHKNFICFLSKLKNISNYYLLLSFHVVRITFPQLAVIG